MFEWGEILMNILKLIGGIFFVAGLAMLAGSSFSYVSQKDFIASAKHAEGEVIDLLRKVSRDDDGDSTTYSAVVRFTDDKAISHEFVNRVSSNPPGYSKGQDVDLLYAPDNPTDAIIDDFWGRWAMVAMSVRMSFRPA